ncbi:MAG: LptF/LptG family permease, partial [Armatimonadetes bacterium]|nr:LptF/LptG family permease [Armatimonadota bacterium]
LMAERAAPWANERANQIIRQMWMQSVVPTAQPNVFLKSDDYTFYIGWLDKVGSDRYLLRNVLVYDTRREGFPAWYTAREATTTRRFWVLRDVVRRDIGKDGMSVHETRLPELSIDLEKDVDFIGGAKTPEEMTADELMAQIRTMKASGAGNMARAYEVDRQFRFSLPLACLVFGLIGIPPQ